MVGLVAGVVDDLGVDEAAALGERVVARGGAGLRGDEDGAAGGAAGLLAGEERGFRGAHLAAREPGEREGEVREAPGGLERGRDLVVQVLPGAERARREEEEDDQRDRPKTRRGHEKP
jgi:hypothetical protein